MTEIIDDLIILGRAVPERLSDGRVTVCLGGYSPSRGFIRLYPTRMRMNIRQWDVVRVEVERNNRDTREESWKIAGSRTNWEQLVQQIEVLNHIESPYERRTLVTANTSPCVDTINVSRRSLGIVHPVKILKGYFDKNPQYGKPEQPLLPFEMFKEDAETWARVKRNFEFEPRLRYVCSECEASQGYHDQKVLEWGFFEWMRKNPDKMEQVWENAKLYSDNHEIHLFVGNQAYHRTSFIVITVLQIQKNPTPPPPIQTKLFQDS